MSSADAEIRRCILEHGAMPFTRFMELSLYGENGYYSTPRLAIGEDGDFVTGSSFSPLFARATATVLARLAKELGGSADYLEAGYGNGEHLSEVVAASPAGVCDRFLGWDRVSRELPASVRRLKSLAEIGPSSIDGLIFSYEFFDAFPVHRLIGRAEGIRELWVTIDAEGDYQWREAEVSDPSIVDLLGGFELADGQIADLSPHWVPTYAELAACLVRGLLVTCDYGFERRRLFDRRVREHGTLACYSRQRVHRNPFVLVGEQDLTAHVDLTALREAGEAAGLQTISLSRQALWLAAAGLFEGLDQADSETREQAMNLMDGEGMGEEIRVLVQAREVAVGAVLDLDVLRPW